MVRRMVAPQFAVLLSILISGCSGDGATVPEGVDGVADGPQPAEVGESASLGEDASGELRKIAEVQITESHVVEFWQSPSGSITVEESYNIDEDSGSALRGFRPGLDTYEGLYESLAGEAAQLDALQRLRAADEVRAEQRAERQRMVTLEGEGSGADVVVADPNAESNLIPKASQADIDFFRTQCVQRRRSASGEDHELCFEGPIQSNYTSWRWNPEGFEMAQVALTNFNFSATGRILVQGVDCGFLELGVCTGLELKERFVPPRTVREIVAESDDGFYTFVEGTDYGVHYLWWW